MKTLQRGGTILGLIFGMVLGLGAALAVAVYVTQVPVPFLSKGGKPGGQDAAETERNKNWDPNAPLQGKVPAPPPAQPPSVPVDQGVSVPPAVAGGSSSSDEPTTKDEKPIKLEKPTKPETKVEAKTDTKTDAKSDSKTAKGSEDPLGDLVKSRSAASDKADKVAQADAAFNYFVQAGAFRGQNEAEAQRAKLGMLGWEARLSEREQNGITIFRVRVGPFTKRDDAEQLKQKLDGAGVDSTLVRSAR